MEGERDDPAAAVTSRDHSWHTVEGSSDGCPLPCNEKRNMAFGEASSRTLIDLAKALPGDHGFNELESWFGTVGVCLLA